MFDTNTNLPDYFMIAGESQNIRLYLYTANNRQLDADGMKARLAISDYINLGGEPLLIKNCAIIFPAGEELAVINVKLQPEDTVNLRGKYMYQFTVKDPDGIIAVLRGYMCIARNDDRAALTSLKGG